MTLPPIITATLSATAPATLEIMIRSLVDAMNEAGSVATMDRLSHETRWQAEISSGESFVRFHDVGERSDLLQVETRDREFSTAFAVMVEPFSRRVELSPRVLFVWPPRDDSAMKTMGRITQELKRRDRSRVITFIANDESALPRGVECDDMFTALSAGELLRLYAAAGMFCEVAAQDESVSREAIIAASLGIPTVTASKKIDRTDGSVVRVDETPEAHVDALLSSVDAYPARSDRFAAVFKTITSSLAL